MGPARWDWAETEVGRILVAATGRGLAFASLRVGDEALRSLRAWAERRTPGLDPVRDPEAVGEATGQLEAYGRGELREFDLELDLQGTDFQLAVWDELRRIPFGVTRTYGEMAGRLGKPGASRAVGAANGKNPIPVIVPCHRVLASGGLGGFTGGLEHKVRLLEHEGVLLPGGFGPP